MNGLTGIGKLDRERLASILRGTKGTVSVAQAASILGASNRGVFGIRVKSYHFNRMWLTHVLF